MAFTTKKSHKLAHRKAIASAKKHRAERLLEKECVWKGKDPKHARKHENRMRSLQRRADR